MQVEKTHLSGVVIITPKRFGDDRGFFSEVWNRQALSDVGIDIDFVQDNHSLSADIGTVRGLHYQRPPHAQDKLVRCGAGAVLDVAVDIRKSSSTYGQSVAVELSAENGKQLLVPKGFLHGFITLQPNSELLYKCSDIYSPECEGSVYFASPTLELDWGFKISDVILSGKDSEAPRFSEFNSPFE